MDKKSKIRDLQIETGSSFITVYSPKNELILKEPSVVLVDKNTRKVIAVGKDAEDKLGNLSGNIDIVKPMRYGFFIAPDIAREVFYYIIKKANTNKVFKPSVVISRPNNSNNYYDSVFQDICEQAGVRKISFKDSLLFTAKRLNIDIYSDKVNMIIDVGSGITKIGVVFKGEVVRYSYLRVASNQFEDAIIDYIKENYNLIVSRKMAEHIKITLGTVSEHIDSMEYNVRARNVDTSIPTTVTISSNELYDILYKVAIEIITGVKSVLLDLPIESIEDLIDNGVYLVGGGSKLKGFKNLIERELNLKVK